MNFYDTHAHLTFKEIDLDVIKRAKESNVNKIINICTDKSSLMKGIELASKYDFIFNAAATYPHDVDNEGKEFFEIVKKYAIEKKLIGIGESGLDYYYEHAEKEEQKKYLKKYFELSLSLNLPIILHCRNAFKDLFEISDTFYKSKKALLHCFTGTIEEAKEVLKRDWIIAFSGIITFKNSDDLREVVKYVPLEKMVIETDAPYLAPQKYRGKKNEPSYIIETAKMISEIKNISLEEVAFKTTANAENFFNN
ncbi:MAG: hydrolase TatD [Chlamydiae bacterium RIFCSPHIGHO2_12_FULL_27_8]|nr:MAG: hydrolase TatD [Chlamydiae bacterium RIFCSPHIGHO2_12_FULL_27_8]